MQQPLLALHRHDTASPRPVGSGAQVPRFDNRAEEEEVLDLMDEVGLSGR
jgi:hypothetical protein